MTASMYGSETRTTAPRWRSASSASVRCSSPAWAPAQTPAIPSLTIEGRFGIARTTGTPEAKWRSIAAVGIAAAIESTVCSGWISGPISPSSVSMSWGLTATTTSAAPAAASAFDSVTAIPCRSRSSSARSCRRVEAESSAAVRQPDESSPLMSTSPICPAPRIAILRGSTATGEV